MSGCHRYTAWVILGASFLAVGCGTSTSLPKTYPASGSVTYRGGRPMTGGSIQLTAASDSLLRVLGEIQADGTFSLYTLKDNAKTNGAPEGEFQVIIQPPLVVDPRSGLSVGHKAVQPIALTKTIKVGPSDNALKIELPVAAPRS